MSIYLLSELQKFVRTGGAGAKGAFLNKQAIPALPSLLYTQQVLTGRCGKNLKWLKTACF